MELYEEILVRYLAGRILTALPVFKESIKEIVEMKCYQVLKEIKEIIEDDSCDDSECFIKIERIVCAFEENGSNGGGRHDFG